MAKRYLDNSDLAERINISNGQMLNTSYIHKFGAVPAMSQNQTGTVWDIDDTLYPWDAFDTAGAATVLAVDPTDANHTVTVVGLDSDYNEISEVLTTSSTGPVTGTKLFKRIYRAYFTDGGQITNTSDIDIQVNSTTVARIKANKAQTLMGVYTIPEGYTGYLTKGTATCQAGADATGDMFVRYFGASTFRVGHSFEVAGVGGQYSYDFTIPIEIPSKSDIDIRATVRSNNARLTVAFDLILIRD